jgi:hypothetical protein
MEIPMRIHFASAAVLVVLALSPMTGAKADPYRWCATGISQSGSSNCYFVTLQQCQASASGTGAFCTPNTFYTGPDSPGGSRSRHR